MHCRQVSGLTAKEKLNLARDIQIYIKRRSKQLLISIVKHGHFSSSCNRVFLTMTGQNKQCLNGYFRSAENCMTHIVTGLRAHLPHIIREQITFLYNRNISCFNNIWMLSVWPVSRNKALFKTMHRFVDFKRYHEWHAKQSNVSLTWFDAPFAFP